MIRSLPIAAILVSSLAFGAVACDKKDEKAPEPTTEATEKPQEEVAAATDEAEDVDVPTQQDFEEKAATEITAQNLEQQLDALEKEIEVTEESAN